MRDFKKVIILLIITITTFKISAQTDTSDHNIDETLENIMQESSSESDNSDQADEIEDLLNNPININTAGIFELEKIPYINSASANLIVEHRKKYGKYFSTNELYMLKDLSDDIVKKVLPFVTVKNIQKIKHKSYWNKLTSSYGIRLRSRMSEDLMNEKGFLNDKFQGNKYKVYNRLKANMNDRIKFGLLTEKDPGEKDLTEFTSGYLSINKLGVVKSFVAGDYILEFGQGLSLWSPYGFSKGSNAVYPVKKKQKNIKPYSSSTENNFFRGAAAELSFQNFILSAFYSKNKFDAGIDSISGFITSTPVTGLHRTKNEIKKRKTAEEKSFGTSLEYQIPNILNTGILFYQSTFSNAFLPGSVYDLNGNKYQYYSFYFDVYFDKINLFGENSYSRNSLASLAGLSLSVNSNFTFISLIRNYPKNYINLHGFGFGERSGKTSNEFGFYNGFRWRSPIGILNFYYDQFKFPYSTYGNPLPNTGDEFLINLESKILKKIRTKIRYKYENKLEVYSVDIIRKPLKRIKQNIRVELIYNFSKQLRLKGRFEYNKIFIKNGNVEKGIMFSQDIRFRPIKKLQCYTRFSIFQTKSFNSAIYQYENGLTGIFQNFVLFGKGIRWYIVAKYQIIQNVKISCKYSEIYKPNEKYLGSGYSQISGNFDNKLGIQLDISY